MSLGIIFLSEVLGTGMLTLLGCGVVANVALKNTKGNNGGDGVSPFSPQCLLRCSLVPTSTPQSRSVLS